ncbi:hypothetical protein SAMN04488540_103141 [Ferrimonas sediminum]|uniref:Uncharacterized protein n=1 Tax=Ferrimonas sediminum TaxID=718193 RepID=A0A1G8NJ15_9GAMM|nr:hypothetical protein [Ferrimonas sediminum]SDI80097.1 hypothetical protein SAMN04488540_103141 [Ferrimonas sediminum]
MDWMMGVALAVVALALGVGVKRVLTPVKPQMVVQPPQQRPCPRCKFTLGYADAPCRKCKIYPQPD